MAKKNRDTSNIDNLLASMTPDMLGDGFAEALVDNSIRVERFLLDMVRPDPVQPRRVLPEQVHHKFHDNRLTPTQALRELVQLAQVSSRQNGRPFSNLLELLADVDNESDESVKLSPEEETLRDLVNLAVTIRDDGQVNPLTVVDITQGVTRLYRIETGERRYWATWILRDFIPSYDHDGMIDCIIIPAEKSSVFRQAKENTARKGLSAIAMARQAALLLLTVHGYEIPIHAVNNDFYRQALDLDLRGKREYTEAILNAMGGIDKARFSRYKALLNLSDEAMELADKHNLDERKLRYVLGLDAQEHAELVQQIISLNLSGKQVKQIIESENVDVVDDDDTPTFSTIAVRFAKTVRDSTKTSGQELVEVLMWQERDAHLVRSRLSKLRQLIDEAETILNG
ncbi:MAG: ParB N-terminal domain-containing protein [Aggregatilineales bacterium]